MEAEDGGEDAELDPAGEEFGFFYAAHVAADVVGPPGVGDVGGGGGEVWLEGEALPGDGGVSGEADGVTVGAEAAPAGEDEGPFLAVAGEVVEVEVVEPVEGV